MRSLIKYELKKLLNKRFLLIMAVLMLSVNVYFLIMNVFAAGYRYPYDTEITAAVSHYGLDYIKWDKEICAQFPGRPVNEKMMYDIDALKEKISGDGDSIGDSTIWNLRYWCVDYSTPDWSFKTIDKVIANPDNPPVFEYTKGWYMMCLTVMLTGIMAVVFSVVSVSDMYAGEYTRRTDSLIFTSMYGRGKLVFAKTAAALSYNLCVFTLAAMINIVILLFCYGADCYAADARIMFNGIFSGYTGSLTCSGAVFMTYIQINMAVTGSTVLTMLVSSVMRTPFSAFVVSAGISVLPYIVEFYIIPSAKAVTALFPVSAVLNSYCDWSDIVYNIGDMHIGYPLILFFFTLFVVLSGTVLILYRIKSQQVKT